MKKSLLIGDFFLFTIKNDKITTMIEVENVLFDFNGTLINDVDLCLAILNRMLATRNHPAVSKERYLEVFTFPVIEYYKKAGFDLPKDNFPALADMFVKEYLELSNTCPLYDGVEDTIEYFKSIKKFVGVVSASEINMLKNQLKFYGILDALDGVSGIDNFYAGGKIESAKRFMAEHKLNPSKTVFVGDTLHDAEVAEALGVKCILVAKGHQNKNVLSQSDFLVIDDIRDLRNYVK